VRIVHSPRHFGGQQAYFACPGLPYRRACNRRAIKLYLHNDQYVCRRCARLANAVENEDKIGRAQLSASKIRRRVGGGPDLAAAFPPRPPRMWRSTYARLQRRYAAAVKRVETLFTEQAARLVARFSNQAR
jgi:hypothetical protein